MGIQVEFNPDLALRKFGTNNRKPEECLPQELVIGKEYSFLKKGQRNYFFLHDIPLRETQGNGKLSKPLAAIQLLEVTHFCINEEVYTKGIYKVLELFDGKQTPYDGYERVE